MSAQEWDDLPWWLRRTYLEGLEEDEVIKPAGVQERQRRSAQTIAQNPLGAADEQFRALGLTVINGGKR